MSSRHNRLRDDQIVNYLLTGEDSEDGMDSGDDDVIDPNFEPFENVMSDDDADTAGIDLNSIINELEDSETIPQPPDPVPDQQATTSGSNSRKNKSKRELQWKLKNLILNDQQVKFSGNSTLPSDLLELDTPIQFFLHLFPKEIMHLIAEQTNLYIIQKNPNQSFSVTESDIQKFIGIVFLMSLIKLPRVTSHWNTNIGTSLIYETMPKNKFEKIRQYIHFNDNSNMPQRNAPDADRLYKIRPIVAKLNESFGKIIKEEYLCVDEQICSTKARNTMKRYNPKKPHKWGYKIYVLCGVTGFAYKFEIETGAENIVLPGDNYFTSLSLLEHLAKEGILSLGTQ
ncbi:piggyBac transposable element-derived protein 4-like [Bicyclus anynana]|uniref:PiggyBac transposable element-derived protein 4-like n=1 Tax=Bicyclus anynana TaxID=110368 RepID=A0A6J1NDJ7_BICAN|nr:piggyBac transposable element-derived protein 4-like [Bicyclus anynana]